MLKKRFIAMPIFWAFFLSAGILFAGQKENPWPAFYEQAPTIEVYDPMASLVGSLPEGQPLTIHLTDVALYSGHVCAGIASGYILTRMALKALYPNSTPRRGQIRVAAMAPSDLLDVASYITGARAFYGRDEINANDLAVDKTLNPHKPGLYVMVFQRKDNGKAVKAVFNKFALMPPQQFKAMKVFLQKTLMGKTDKKTKEENTKKIQAMVKNILLNPPEGIFKIIPINGYKFPVEAEQ